MLITKENSYATKKTIMNNFFQKNKVFIIGLFIALLSSIYELSSTSNPSPWILGWSAVIAVLTYFANNVRGQAASIFSTILSSSILFFQAHGQPDGLSMKEVMTTAVLPLSIQILGLFYTSPTKPREYEQSPTVVQAKQEASDIVQEKKQG